MKYFDVWDMDTNFAIELPFDENNFYFNFKSFGTEVRNPFGLVQSIQSSSIEKYDPWMQEHRTISKEVRKYYFGNAKIEEKTKMQYLDMLNDAFFIYSIHKSMKANVKHSKAKTYHIQWVMILSPIIHWFYHCAVKSFFFF